MAQQVKIIGRGTWLDKVADEVIQREKKLGRGLSLIRVESGLAASGFPHIGSVGDAIRSFGVKLALETIGYKSELVAYSDDLDGLRKVPAGLPDSLKDYIAHPVTQIPDPFDCHGSYGDHMSALLRTALDSLGIEYRFISGAEAYRTGILNDQIRKILANADKIGKTIKGMVGQDKYEKALPYTPICNNCGRVYTTQVYSYVPKRDVVLYRCEGTELGKKFLKGCGYKGDAKISDGKGKLIWKTEFAARWAALDIRFEAYGKELTDSVKINDWVAERILGFPAPYHVRYELFQDKSGKKMSKSTGNLVTPEEWLNVASPESLRFLMFKRIIGARNISLEDVPTYMDEFDDLDEYYFSKEKDSNLLKDAKQRGLYEYAMLLKVPQRKRDHVPYRLLTQLASMAPEGGAEEYVVKRLMTYGMVKEVAPELKDRIVRASRWAKKDTTSQIQEFVIPPRVTPALRDFAERLGTSKTHDQVQAAAFESLNKHGLKPNEFFPAVYRILLGVERGPRLGPYVMDTGAKYVAGKIHAALAASKE